MDLYKIVKAYNKPHETTNTISITSKQKEKKKKEQENKMCIIDDDLKHVTLYYASNSWVGNVIWLKLSLKDVCHTGRQSFNPSSIPYTNKIKITLPMPWSFWRTPAAFLRMTAGRWTWPQGGETRQQRFSY